MSTSISFRSGNKLQTIVFDAATSIRPVFKNTVSKHPVEKGADATDNTRQEPDVVTLETTLTDYPLKIDGKGIGAPHEAGRAGDILAELLLLKNKGVRVKLQTSLRVYSNMMIESISPNADRLKGAIKLSILLSESQIVESDTIAVVPKNRINQKQDDKGKKNAPEASAKDGSNSWAQQIEKSDAGQAGLGALKKASDFAVEGPF